MQDVIVRAAARAGPQGGHVVESLQVITGNSSSSETQANELKSTVAAATLPNYLTTEGRGRGWTRSHGEAEAAGVVVGGGPVPAAEAPDTLRPLLSAAVVDVRQQCERVNRRSSPKTP